tara:strand:+ start:13794 stop:14666 length:873 start_codon:yes stop_codon:yes gene_type:complete
MIIGTSGRIGSGKDLVGNIIQALVWLNKSKENKLESHIGKFSLEQLVTEYDMWFAPKGIRGMTNVRKESGFEIKKFADKLKDIVCLLLGCDREQLEDHDFKNTPLGKEWDKLQITYSDGFDEVTGIFDSNFDTDTLLDAKGRVAYIHKKQIIKLTPRKILQLLGTEAGRQTIHPNIWINSLFVDYIRPSHWENRYYDEVNKKGLAGKEEIFGDLPNWIITDVRFENEAQAIKDRDGILIRVNRGSDNSSSHISETALDNYQDWSYVIDNNGSIEDLIVKVKEILIKENVI